MEMHRLSLPLQMTLMFLMVRKLDRVERGVSELEQEVWELMATSAEARAAVEKVNAKADELIVLAKEIKAKLDEGVDENPEHTADIDAMFDSAEAQSGELDVAIAELRDFEPSVQ